MKNALLLFVTLILSTIAFAQVKIEAEGAIIIGNSEDSTITPGTIRFTGLNFEGWNGVYWVSLTPTRLNQIITDIDGNEYRTVIIGTQEWMAENLRTTKYRNGDDIPNITNGGDWGDLSTGAYCWYDNDISYKIPYGAIYNWFAVDDARGLCPTGWHVPTDAEWTTLTDYLGGTNVAGGKLKEAGFTHWNSPNTGATNEFGFTALPGGNRSSGSGSFFNIGGKGFWHSSDESGSNSLGRELRDDSEVAYGTFGNKKVGKSVRCVKD